MAFEPFNSVGGFTVGIPPTPVINDEGIATLNGLQVAGISNLGSINNVILLGGEDGYYLQTNGSGGLTWAPANGGGGGNGVPGGSNSEVQFNDAGDFGGDAGFTYNKVTNQLAVSGNIISTNFVASGNVSATNFVASGNVSGGNVSISRLTATGNISAANANLGNFVAANFYAGNGYLLSGVTASSSNYANYAGNVLASNQPNITSLGTLTSITVTGDATFSSVANVTITGGSSGQVLTTDGYGNLSWQNAPAATTASYVTANNQSNITSVGTLTFLTVSGVSTLGPAGNVKISGGTSGYLLSTDGSGNLSWTAPANGGGIGGTNTQVQFNDGGSFAGNSSLTFNKTTKTLEIAGHLVANSYQMGSTGYAFSNTFVYFATTASANPNQVLWDIPVANITAVDFTIFGSCADTDASQSAKISSLVRGSSIVYNEYAGLAINNGVGVFSVTYNSGASSMQLIVDPDTSSITEYNLVITVYNNYP